MRNRITGRLAAALTVSVALTGCSLVPSPTLDASVMSAASRAESAAAEAAEVLAEVQAATEAMNAAAAGEDGGEDLSRTIDKTFNMVPITSEDGKYQILVPENWEDLRGQLDPGGMDDQYLIETGSYDEQIFLIFNSETTDGSSLTSFDDYFTSLTRGMTGSSMFTDVQTSNPVTVTLKTSQLQGKKVTFTATYHPTESDEQKISCRIYGAQGNGEYIQFCCWTTAANSAMMDELIDTVVDSFSVK